ncbi:FecR family protein [Solitalea lacus]|uniref:FecR family protein n=1 Tax=Solitalea lacus TaxID=2911172 RepID=UPI001EDB375D|nr:FecR domain-containing protein [Solitalea lacus]UKJ06814.1 FecR domain-containing protein [Solitalea lacus]
MNENQFRMKYSNYRAEDFASDVSFLNYHHNSNEEDVFFWKKWIALNPKKREEVNAAIILIQSLSYTKQPLKFEHNLRELENYINSTSLNQVTTQIEKQTTKKIFSLSGWVKIAAMTVFAISLLFSIYKFIQPNNTKQLIAYTEFYSEAGQTNTLVLSDGSKITIHGNSKLKYPKTFSGDERRVELEGEAFFEVVKDKKHPFIISTGKLETRVLGTSFNVRAYPSDQTVKVALVTGKVKVTNIKNNESMHLVPSQMAVFSKSTQRLAKQSFNNEVETGWRNGVLLFTNASFAELKAKIEAQYGITLINESAKQKWTYTGRIAEQNMKEAMQNICFVKGLSYEIKGDTVIVK